MPGTVLHSEGGAARYNMKETINKHPDLGLQSVRQIYGGQGGRNRRLKGAALRIGDIK